MQGYKFQYWHPKLLWPYIKLWREHVCGGHIDSDGGVRGGGKRGGGNTGGGDRGGGNRGGGDRGGCDRGGCDRGGKNRGGHTIVGEHAVPKSIFDKRYLY